MKRIRSSTDLAMGPKADLTICLLILRYLLSPVIPLSVNLPAVGLNPKTPQKAAGSLILPSESLDIPIGEHLAAINPASPPELDPHVLSLFHGFKPRP